MTKRHFVQSASTNDRWTTQKLHDESVRYLKNEFFGEDSKIKGSTYTTETCQPLKCGKKCKSANQTLQEAINLANSLKDLVGSKKPCYSFTGDC